MRCNGIPYLVYNYNLLYFLLDRKEGRQSVMALMFVRYLFALNIKQFNVLPFQKEYVA